MNQILRKVKSGYRRISNGLKITLFPEKFYIYQKKIYDYHNCSYSQEGEDMILARLFAEKKEGFYVDVGAHHPQRFSNTYMFYLKGWRGINIDAMPGNMKLFNEIRPKDINLEFPVSDSNHNLTYYEFNEPALNGFCDEISKKRDGLKQYKIVAQKELYTYTLSQLLDEYLPSNQKIDFLSIDVEGLDYNVLNSNNWQKYRPQVVLVEDLALSSLREIDASKVITFMYEQKYNLYCKTVNTLIFITKYLQD